MAKSTARLGKGLNALISSTPTIPAGPPVADAEVATDGVRRIATDRIRTNPYQPRQRFAEDSLKELSDSIRNNGMIQPVVVRPLGDGDYELIAGERRVRAAQMAGIERIPAIVRDVSDTQSFELALVENLQREDLAPIERAMAYQNYITTFNSSIEQLAKRLSESRANISNYIRLLSLQSDVLALLDSGELGMGQARALAAISSPERQLALARTAVRRNLSVRQVEELVRHAQEPIQTRTARAANAEAQHIGDVEESLSKALGLRVRLQLGRKKNSGRVVISYANLEEFDVIAERLGGRVHLE